MTTKTDRESIRLEAESLSRVEHLVATNSGTYSAEECCRKVGCGDSQFGDRNVYETVGGQKRVTGPDHEDAPGYMRQINSRALSEDRKRLAELYRQLRD